MDSSSNTLAIPLSSFRAAGREEASTLLPHLASNVDRSFRLFHWLEAIYRGWT